MAIFKQSNVWIRYPIVLGALILCIKWFELRFFLYYDNIFLLTGSIALIFALLGIVFGRIWRKQDKMNLQPKTTENNSDLEIESISKRELEVLQLMNRGLSNQEIADTLFVSLNTVKTHTGNLYKKLKVNKRNQAIKMAKDHSILQ